LNAASAASEPSHSLSRQSVGPTSVIPARNCTVTIVQQAGR
jgi:hypothetical protein